MESKQNGRSYARKVQEDTRRYAERQASLANKLEWLVAALETERTRLLDEVMTLKDVLHSRAREHSRLSQEMLGIVEENKRLSKEYVLVEHQSSNLASLYVASVQLHANLGREQVLATIQEIVIGLIGCEELAVFEVGSSHLTPISWFGIDERRFEKVPLGTGLIGRTAATGETYVRNARPAEGATAEESELTACIPLKANGMVTGVIALFRLLSHKPALEDEDHELFDLLSRQAASALYCAQLHEEAASEAT